MTHLRTISELSRLIGYASGIIEGASMQVEDKKLRDTMTNAYHEIQVKLDEIFDQ